MAQASKASRKQSSRSKASRSGRTGKKSTGRSKSAARGKARTRQAGGRAGKRATAHAGAAANAAMAGKSAAAGTRAAGKAARIAVSEAKVPLITGGAALAGLAGGLAVLRRRNDFRSNGVLDLDKLISGAQRLGSFGEEVGELAAALQRATQGSD